MVKLKLSQITKTYQVGDTNIEALKNISLQFRQNEFVTILGPSGCGKTTLLNIIGGLDRYDSGELLINGFSTKQFKDLDWDTYRSLSVGFVFQNYNLILHQSVLQNVEIAMILSGVPVSERKQRAIRALESVGLGDQINKKPNQLSGGQMQRVAIARALVNNPDIILADEPTGAIDSQTSVQIMDILHEISKDKLVIMVTHNQKLVKEYSSRVIQLMDGEVKNDSNPVIMTSGCSETVTDDLGIKWAKLPSMPLFTAISLSWNNLLSKIGRTMITSFAGSFGIIGVALVLALSSGLSSYINVVQSDTLAGSPISISTIEQSVNFMNGGFRDTGGGSNRFDRFTEEEIIYRYDRNINQVRHKNVLTDEYIKHIEGLETVLSDAVNSISYTSGITFNLLAKGEGLVVKFDTTPVTGMGAIIGGGNAYWQEMPDNANFVLSLYDLIGEGSRLPSAKNEVALVVDEYNRLEDAFFNKLGIFTDVTSYSLNEFIGSTILKVILNDHYYTPNSEGIFMPAESSEYIELFHGEDGIELTITGILRIKEDAVSSLFSQGFIYTKALTDFVVADAHSSAIALAQQKSEISVISNIPFANDTAREQQMIRLGAVTRPTGINIYPKDFAGKDQIKDYLDAFNQGKSESEQVLYTDFAEMVTNSIKNLLNTITYVLIGFSAISLVVSTIMIGVITYISVMERTKEIGILRSVGARKKDIARVFNAETLIVGLTAGLLGVFISYLLIFPINMIISRIASVQGIADLNIITATILVLGSMALTLFGGLTPARMAAGKDPVVALRTE